MGNCKDKPMKKLAVIFILIPIISSYLYADKCSDYDEAYDIAMFTLTEEDGVSYRKSYNLMTELINTGTMYLAYCSKTMTSSQQYQLKQSLKRADKKRGEYFSGAVREYHAIYGIRPNVQVIYQTGGGYSTGHRGTNRPSSPHRFPPVQQTPMPAIPRY